MEFDNSLQAFSEIKQQWNGLFIGNGASRAISSSFAYASLYQTACSSAISHPLVTQEQQIFDALQTKNFEQVLSALALSRIVTEAFHMDSQQLQDSYERIRIALVESVHAIHVPHAEVSGGTLGTIRTALLEYEYIYSTNYDLLIYWAIMQDSSGFVDYFFSGPVFDISNTEVWQKSTKVLFLHGALHLYRTASGGTFKRSAGAWSNLLSDFGTPIADEPGTVPLFITEGTFTDKVRSIFTSDYLSFAYNQLARHSGPIVIFGQSLEEQFDRHLISAIRSSSTRILGIGIHPGSLVGSSVAATKAQWFIKFPHSELFFFDSSTHPLGDSALQVHAS